MISDEDRAHMHNIAYGGMMRSITPEDVAEKLVSSGYARLTTAGTLLLTESGHMVLGKPSGFVEMGKK